MKAKLGLLTKRSTLALFLRQGNMMDILTNFKNELRNQIDLFNVCVLFLESFPFLALLVNDT